MLSSPRKSSSALSLIPEEHCKMPSSTKSCESLYSNASSCKGSGASLMYRRKTPPMATALGGGSGNRQGSLIPATTEVRQRVLSARRLHMKTYQNQLADAQQTIAELAHENRILRTLHKRQDSALAKYESTNAELPQLLHSHAEELRVWQTKHRSLQTLTKELEQKLKHKETLILSLSDQNKYYSQLNKDKNLDERQRLTEKMQGLETRLQEKDQDMKLLARKMQLEAKNFKQQLTAEQRKTRDALLKLEKARLELSGYHKLDELQLSDKLSHIGFRRRPSASDDAPPLPKREKDLKSEMLSEDEEPSEPSSQPRPMGVTARIGTPLRKTHALTPLHRRSGDRGDGDAACLGGDMKCTISSTTIVKSSTINKRDRDRLDSSPEYADDYENDGDGDATDDGLLTDRDQEGGGEMPDDDGDAAAAEEEDYDEPGVDDIDEGDDDDDDEIVMKSSKTATTTTHMRAEISSIRKQITTDYQEREAFLDTFCRQASGNALLGSRDETAPPPPGKRNGLTASISSSAAAASKNIKSNSNMPSSRKNKLLAALRAIDDNKSVD